MSERLAFGSLLPNQLIPSTRQDRAAPLSQFVCAPGVYRFTPLSAGVN
jgi:hypothetical protein